MLVGEKHICIRGLVGRSPLGRDPTNLKRFLADAPCGTTPRDGVYPRDRAPAESGPRGRGCGDVRRS
eukprot:4055408-Pyramimonas_sp.AAC.1